MIQDKVYNSNGATAMQGAASVGAISKIVTVYPDTAQAWLNDRRWERQRPMKTPKVKHYAEIMKRGEWIANSTIRTGTLGNRHFLLDGQHRLQAVVESQTSQRFNVVEETVSDEVHLAAIYSAIDRGAQRTPFDQLHALGVDDQYGWTATQLNAITASVKFIATDFHPHRSFEFRLSEVQALIDKYASAFDLYIEMGANAPEYVKTAAKRRSTIAVAMITITQSSARYGMDTIKDFWHGVLTDDGIAAGDARKVAHQHLITSGIKGGGQSMSKDENVSAPFSARYLASCFNAYTENRRLTFTRVSDETAPIKINGSLYNGKSEKVESLAA